MSKRSIPDLRDLIAPIEKNKPRKREKKPSNKASVRRDWPNHRKWVRSLLCCVCGVHGRTEAHHIRKGTDGAASKKPSDWFIIPLCHECHAEYHQSGHDTFEARHELDCLGLAEELAKQSPEFKMQQFAGKRVGIDL